VTCVIDPKRATFLIEDEGEGFDHVYYMQQIDNQEAFKRAKERIRQGNRGGLGILLMHKCTDRLEYTGRGNIVRIEKRLA
jgi:anti-sigma regulatory factor (Ser/Thr protein kinase)